VIAHGKIVAEVVSMTPRTLLVAAAVLLSAPLASAQESEPRVAVPRSEAAARRAAEPQRQAEPQRVPIQRAGPVQRAEPAAQQPVAPIQPPQTAVNADAQQRRAVPRGSRPREDNPPVGVAVPRSSVVRPPAGRGPVVVNRGPRVVNRGYYRTPTVYNNYYYYPRRSYPYGYGAFGLGYFYYNPYSWPGYSVNIGVGSGYPYYGGYYGGPYYGSGYYGAGGFYPRPGYPVGHLRLRVTPRHAQVFVDGYYAGVVDDYDGIVQALALEDGPYHIELVAPGFQPLEFDVRIIPGQKITYRGDLIPQRP
jgi:hypothetical protein